MADYKLTVLVQNSLLSAVVLTESPSMQIEAPTLELYGMDWPSQMIVEEMVMTSDILSKWLTSATQTMQQSLLEADLLILTDHLVELQTRTVMLENS